MSTENNQPNGTARTIALSALVIVLAGAWWFTRANRPSTAVATDCSGFAADARTFFSRGDATVALNGTFAPGDHLHLAIDLNGMGYAYELKGVMAMEPGLSGSGNGGMTHTVVTTTRPTPNSESQVTESTGAVSGYARMDMDIDVTAAGTGAMTIRKTGLWSWFTSPKVTEASCSSKPARSAV
jgi:hypothetical protein